MFSAALNSTPYHPPRCCGTFVPLSMLYKLYPAPAASIVAEKLSEKEAPEAAAASVPPPSPASVPPPNPAVESSTPAEITPIPAPPASLPKLTHKLASFRALTPNPVDCAHCSRWILPEDISEEAETGYCNPLYGGGCGGRTCVVCLEAAHEKWTKWAEVVCTGVPEKERGEVRFRRLVGREGWRECGKCGWTLSRDLGCSEVVCRCGNYETLAF